MSSTWDKVKALGGAGIGFFKKKIIEPIANFVNQRVIQPARSVGQKVIQAGQNFVGAAQRQLPQVTQSVQQSVAPKIESIARDFAPRFGAAANLLNQSQAFNPALHPIGAPEKIAKLFQSTRNVPVAGDLLAPAGDLIRSGTAPIRSIQSLTQGDVQGAQQQLNQSPLYQRQQKVKQEGGNAFQQFAPAVGLGAEVGTSIAPVPALKGGSLLAKVGKGALAGGVAGGGFEGGRQVYEGEKFNPKDIAVASGLGAATVGAAPLVGAGVKVGAKALSKAAPKVGSELQTTLADQRGSIKLPGGDESKGIPVSQTDLDKQTKELINKGLVSHPGVVPDDSSAAANYRRLQAAIPTKGKKVVSGETKEMLDLNEATPEERALITRENNPKVGEFNPTTPKQGDWRQAVKNADAQNNILLEQHNKAVTAAAKLDSEDLKLMDKLASRDPVKLSKQAKNPEAFIKAAQAAKDFHDFAHAQDVRLGRPVPYRKNYGGSLYFDTTNPAYEEGIKQFNAELSSQPKRGLGRGFQDYAEAEKHGVPRKNANYIEDLHDTLQRYQYDLGQAQLERDLRASHPEQISNGSGGGFDQLRIGIPGAENLSAERKLAQEINKRARPSESTKPMALYDRANRNIKYIQLGGGTFHALTELGTIGGQRLTSPTAWKNIGNTGRWIAGTLSKRQHIYNMATLEKDGVVNAARQSGVTLRPDEILSDANSGFFSNLKGKNPVTAFIKGVHDMVFQRQIPYAKLIGYKEGMTEKFGKDLDFRNLTPDQVEYGGRLARAWNNIGGINRLVEGTTPTQLKWLSRAVLATDYTEGRFRTIAFALAKGGPEGKIARQMVIGKTILYAIPGLAALAAQGKLDTSSPEALGKQLWDQVLNPSVSSPWKTPGGIPKTIKMPATFLSEIGRLFLPTVTGEKADKLGGIKHYAGARLAALPSTIEQIATNQNYYGEPIIAGNNKGGIDVGKSALNLAESKAPIPIAQAAKTAQGKQTLGEAITNTIGFRVTADVNDPRIKEMTAVQNADEHARKKLTFHVGQEVNGEKIESQSKADKVTQQYQSAYDLIRSASVQGGDVWKPEAIAAVEQMLLKGGDVGRSVIEMVRKTNQKQEHHDPVWDLPTEHLDQALILKTFPPNDEHLNPASKALKQQVTGQQWYKDYQVKLDEYIKYLDSLPKGEKKPWVAVPEQRGPQAPATVSQYNPNATSQEKKDFFRAHPEVSDYFSNLQEFGDTQRKQMGLIPELTDQQRSSLKEYNRLTSGGGKAGAFVRAHPELGAYFNYSKALGAESDVMQGKSPASTGSRSRGGRRRGGGRRGRGGKVPKIKVGTFKGKKSSAPKIGKKLSVPKTKVSPAAKLPTPKIGVLR